MQEIPCVVLEQSFDRCLLFPGSPPAVQVTVKNKIEKGKYLNVLIPKLKLLSEPGRKIEVKLTLFQEGTYYLKEDIQIAYRIYDLGAILPQSCIFIY